MVPRVLEEIVDQSQRRKDVTLNIDANKMVGNNHAILSFSQSEGRDLTHDQQKLAMSYTTNMAGSDKSECHRGDKSGKGDGKSSGKNSNKQGKQPEPPKQPVQPPKSPAQPSQPAIQPWKVSTQTSKVVDDGQVAGSSNTVPVTKPVVLPQLLKSTNNRKSRS